MLYLTKEVNLDEGQILVHLPLLSFSVADTVSAAEASHIEEEFLLANVFGDTVGNKQTKRKREKM